MLFLFCPWGQFYCLHNSLEAWLISIICIFYLTNYFKSTFYADQQRSMSHILMTFVIHYQALDCNPVNMR